VGKGERFMLYLTGIVFLVLWFAIAIAPHMPFLGGHE
jgi:hypothetical protein